MNQIVLPPSPTGKVENVVPCLHAQQNGWSRAASPVRLKRSALPPTAQVWTIVGWLEGDMWVFNPTLAPGVVPDETTFAQLVADQLERDNGEAVIGTILVQCVTILKGKAVQS